MKKIKLVFLGVFAFGLFVTSCDKEKEESITNISNVESSAIQTQDLRQQLIISGDPVSQLTNEELLEVNISKINQLLTNNLPQVESDLLENLKLELFRHSTNQPNTVTNIGIQLANLIPEEDFILMFFELEDYNYNGAYIGTTSVSQEIKDEIFGLKFLPGGGASDPEPEPSLGVCDCSWTCTAPSSKCASTSSGCGFFMMYPCTSTDYTLIPK